jgi:transcription elongation factor S-II
MSSSTLKTVSHLKNSLSKELDKDGNSERCIDLINQLDGIGDMSLSVLTETLIGTIVSKFKSHDDPSVSSAAKALVKKWKQLAKQAGVGKVTTAPTKPATKSKPKSVQKVAAPATTNESAITEWDHLPGIRKNIANKLYQTFIASTESLEKSGIHADALKSLTTSRASEVEIACHELSKGKKQSYQDKVRSLIFNLKKNTFLREDVILGNTSAETLVKMSKQQLATAEKSKERNATVEKLRGSRRLDWEEANEDKINEMCGIDGELLQASLFTCGRCKSIKTTSTQKQTRSADEPMTVFVLCLNCGNRWKC